MQRRPAESEFQVGGYYNERLDDVHTRLARIEGKMESLASREDLANAKFHLLSYWIGLGLAITVATVNTIFLLIRAFGT